MSAAIDLNAPLLIPCPICLDDMPSVDERIATICGHVFHESCLDRWLREKNVCPLCQTNNPLNRVITPLDVIVEVEHQSPVVERNRQIERTFRVEMEDPECILQLAGWVCVAYVCWVIGVGIYSYTRNHN